MIGMKWPGVNLMMLLCSASCELYSSIVGTEKLLHTEISTIQIFQSYILETEKKIEGLKRQFEMLKQEHKKSIDDPSNPLISFNLIKRLLMDWSIKLDSTLSDGLSEEAKKNINVLKSSDNFPKHQDLIGSVEALNRISDTYKIDKASLANGKVDGIQYSAQLSANDCFEMSRQSYLLNEYHHAYSWINEALKRFETEGNTKDVVLEELESKAYLAYKLGDFSTAFNITAELLKHYPNNTSASGNMEHFAHLLEKAEKAEKMENNVLWQDNETYMKICIKAISPPVEITSQLKCRYINNDVPFLRLAPLKEEEAYLNPRIVLYKDVLYDSEIEILKEMAVPKLETTGILDVTKNIGVVSKYRIGQMSWFGDDEHPIIRTITQRSEDITKLVAYSAEKLHIVNYGIGGYYAPHHDYFEDSPMLEEAEGNRIATLLFYMNGVDQGGITAFPKLHLGLSPEKGTAVLWFNLSPDGKIDQKTYHASCPVVARTKWILTKWFHERGQEFRRPCELKM